ncbi:MAG: GTPase ObgE [Nitrospirota bacterium]
MQFADYVTIFVRSGDGGKGCVSFRREKYVPRGGPDGGDGGRGGDVVFQSTRVLNTLLDQTYHREYRAQRGQHGMGKKMHGKNGDDLIIQVPVGTVIRDAGTKTILADLDRDEMRYIAAKGGKGGLGNSHFATPTRQAPRYAQPGETGEERWLILELKLLADVGLIGLPNAGKSTLLSVISAARPRIAEYPFTTLAPVLGVVKRPDFTSFVVADIPGLIEGAHKGAGLGFQFLRHTERTAILLHLVDISGISPDDPIGNLETINREIGLYNQELLKKPQIVVGTKLDIAGDGLRLRKLEQYCATNGREFYPVSAVTSTGIQEVLLRISAILASLRDNHTTNQ